MENDAIAEGSNTRHAVRVKSELKAKATEHRFKAVAATCMGERLHHERMCAMYERAATLVP